MPNQDKQQKNPPQKTKAETLLLDYIQEQDLPKIGIACSAGIDSMSLLAACSKLFEPSFLCCLHYDHALRDDSHLADLFLADYCQRTQIRYHSERNHQSVKDEDQLRTLRYNFFLKAASKLGLKHILLAHNINDNAETILFRLFRGTNSHGICGIPQKRELSEGSGIYIHRPWLKLSRDEISSYAQQLDLSYIEDSSNTNTHYARNLIRLEIIPQILKINPQAINNINIFASLIAEQNDYIQETLFTDFDNSQDPELNWDLETFSQLPRLVQRKLLEKYFCSSIYFTSLFIEAIAKGGFHRINFTKAKYFCIRQKRIRLEYE